MSTADTVLRGALEEAAADLGRVLAWRVGFSGGRDSTVLLHVVASMFGGRVTAWHVNHHLLPESDAWERHCRVVSDSLGVGFEVQHVYPDASANVEGRARSARYAAWRARLRYGEVLLLAHHLEDQAETVLWRLLRGGGTDLLRGMPARRALGAGRLVRPFLGVERRVIGDYAAAYELTWVEDPANDDEKFDRSFLRKRVLPVLRERFPSSMHAIAHAAAQFSDDAGIVDRALDECLEDIGATAETVPVSGLLSHTHGERLLRRWLLRRGVRGVGASVLHEVLAQAAAAPDRAPRVEMRPGVFLRRYRNTLRVAVPTAPFEPRRWALAQPLELAHGRLDAERVEDGELAPAVAVVEVRGRRRGDRLQPAGRSGTRVLKDLFQAAAVPPWDRDAYPLLCVDGALALVPRIAVAQGFAAHGPGWRIRWTPHPPVAD